MKTIDTKSLLQIIMNNPTRLFEVSLIINNLFRATHFIYTIDAVSLFDEGIDGEETCTLIIDFFHHYKNKLWIIDKGH